MLILAFAISAVLGYLAISSVWPDKKVTFAALMIRISLSPGFGLGIFSVVFWLARLSGYAHVVSVDVLLLILLGFTYAVQRSRADKGSLANYSSSSLAQSRDLALGSPSRNQSFPE